MSRDLFLKHLAQTSPEPPLYHFSKAEGIYLYDENGKAYIDLISGIAVNNIGHRNPKVISAIKNQLDQYLHQMVYGEYLIGPQITLAKKISQQLPDSLSSFYFLNSGSEAIEGAIKLARKHTGRKEIIALEGAYHGSTTGALSLMSDPYYSDPFKPLLADVKFLKLNNLESLEIISEQTAAVFIEPIQAESGYNPATIAFLKAARKKCTEHSALLVFDEIQSGYGRTGSLFAFQDLGVQPDILCMAKGMGGGMPIGAFASSHAIMDSLKDNPILGHITTFGGHPVSCAAAIATLDFIIEENLCESVNEKEKLIREKLKHPKILKITGKGLMLAIHLSSYEEVTTTIERCFNQGLIIDWFLYANNALRISPPLTIRSDELDAVCSTILKSLD